MGVRPICGTLNVKEEDDSPSYPGDGILVRNFGNQMESIVASTSAMKWNYQSNLPALPRDKDAGTGRFDTDVWFFAGGAGHRKTHKHKCVR